MSRDEVEPYVMIRRHGAALRVLLALVDGTAALILIASISELRFGGGWPAEWAQIFAVTWAPAALVAAAWVVILWGQGLYRLRARWSFGGHVVAMARALAVMTVAVFAALFLFKVPEVSRAFLLVLLPALAATSLLLRAFIHAWLTSLRRRGRNSRNVLVVGSGTSAIRFTHELDAHSTLGLHVVGYVDGAVRGPSLHYPFLGPLDDLAAVLHDHVVDEVAICLDLADWEVIQRVVELCRAEGKVIRIPLAGGFLSGSASYVEDLSGMPVLSIMERPDRQIGLAIKRGLDLAVAGIALSVGLPLILAVAFAVALDSGRPVLFRQQRVGLHGRRFQLIKFRTMVRDAEQQQHQLLWRNEVKGQAFKLTDDPRVTRVGAFLRRSSFDELPQLWNVLRGEMSLIGPRPPLPAEVHEYDTWHRRRLSMKPGMTGLWQIESRREPDFNRWVQKDLEYIDGWSLWLDTKIALKTLPALLRTEGR